MDRSLRITLAAVATASLLIVPACTKGSRLGGTELEPAAVETAGVPEFHAHAAPGEAHGDETHGEVTHGEHDNIATPAEQHAAPVAGRVNDQLEPGASSAGDLPPDGGNVVVEPADTDTN